MLEPSTSGPCGDQQDLSTALSEKLHELCRPGSVPNQSDVEVAMACVLLLGDIGLDMVDSFVQREEMQEADVKRVLALGLYGASFQVRSVAYQACLAA